MESTSPSSASLSSLPRRVVAGTRLKRASSLTVVSGAEHNCSRASSCPGRREGASARRFPAERGTLVIMRCASSMAHVAASMASTLSPTAPRTALGRARPMCPRSTRITPFLPCWSKRLRQPPSRRGAGPAPNLTRRTTITQGGLRSVRAVRRNQSHCRTQSGPFPTGT